MSGEQTAAHRHLQKFVESTSVRGVSRAYKTDVKVVRVMWTFAVVLCASLLLYQVLQVVDRFLDYEFSTVSKEDELSDIVS